MQIRPTEHPPDQPANPFARLRTVAAIVGLYAVALLAWLVIGEPHPAGRWFGVHLFTLGIVTNLILALSGHFARTLTHQGGTASRWQPLIVNVGILAVLVGIPSDRSWIVAAGATILTVEVMRSYLELRRYRTRALAGRFSWIVRSYERAHGAFVHGAILGLLVGTGIVSGPWWISARTAHLHVNVLGWAGITLLATVVFFGPTMLRTRIRPGAEVRARRALRWGATGLTVGVLALFGTGVGGRWGLVLRLAAAAGLLVYAWAVVEVCLPVIAAAAAARPSSARPALITASSWFVAIAFLDVVVVATAGWRYLDALGVAMLAGVLFQTIAASLGYLAPLLLRSDVHARADRSERIDKHGTPRAAVWNLGVALATVAAAAGGQQGEAWTIAARMGWGLMLTAVVWLGVAALLPHGRRNGAGDASITSRR